MHRRKFLESATLSSTGIMLGSSLAGCSSRPRTGIGTFDIMKEALKFRKIDSHEHTGLYAGDAAEQIDFADRLGIEKLVISKPVVGTAKATPDEFRECNNIVLRAMRQFPDRILGQLTLNPVYGKESLEEISRCMDQGMVGIKVYYQVKINDPLFYPIIEKAIDLGILILMHANCQLGMGGYRMKYDLRESPNTSIPDDFVDAARRYPEAMLQYAHTGGGGDWEYACKAMKDFPNLYVDTSGSNNEGNMINFALSQMGEDRLFFGTDSSYYQGVGNVLASDLTDSQRKKIFFDNYNAILKKGGFGVV